MAILIGIDEAGFGPILGPLVVSSSAFRIADNLVWANLWKILRSSVAKNRTSLRGRLLIADSKKAYSRQIGIKHLKRTVLSVLKHLNREPKSMAELITALCPDCLEHIGQYPWYKNAAEFDLQREEPVIDISVAMLRRDLEKQGFELLNLKSRCLEVAHYNQMISAIDNKAKVLFTAVAELIQSAIDDFPGEDLDIAIDHQGGRCYYRRELQLMFGDCDLRIIHEDQNRSSYELTIRNPTAERAENVGWASAHQSDSAWAKAHHTNPVSAVKQARRVRLHFIVGADDQFLPVSLASMACKYMREVLIENLNNYFLGFNPEIKPTSGYWKDGERFIKDIKTHIPNLTFNTNQLIRCR